MVQLYSRFFFTLFFLMLSCGSLTVAQTTPLPAGAALPSADKSLQFIETKNRIGHGVQYEAMVPGGRLFLHPTKFTYNFYQTGQHQHGHDEAARHEKDHTADLNATLKGHAVTVTFVGAGNAKLIPAQATQGRYNYFLGNDKSKWVSNAKGYRQIDYDNLYPGIDMRLHEQNGKLKYEFFLEKGADPAAIKMRYAGADKLEIKNGELVVTTSLNTITESKPYTYQIVNGKEQPVACYFKISGNEVSFDFPEGYDPNLPLVIDPELMYSTYSGSAADNWGFTATYDDQGNIYSGGIVFGNGFPTDTGAYDMTYNGANRFMHDIGILKYDPTQAGAASLVYATYIGGSGTEAPHSLVVNSFGELLIYGTTGSIDYPVTSLAYDQSFAGGPLITPLTIGFDQTTGASVVSHPVGSDIIISKLSNDGSELLASTFLGGTDTDGLLLQGDPLVKNYGDQFRGDVITDANNNVYITSSTASSNFPIENGYQPAHASGGTDAIVCMFSPDLSTLMWSTFLGGSGMDAAYSIQIDSLNNVVVAGGTTSANFPTTQGVHSPSYNQGIDGFIARLSLDGTTLLHSTYLGTSAYDQVYFVQLDDEGNVYAMGQTLGAYPVSAGVYSVPNSKQFIHKFTYDLSTTIFSTVFGSPNGIINISPTAFLVNNCNSIYVAGWGGATNTGYSGGNTHNMPITPGATQTTTDGSDFYIIALSNDASSLILGTYLGANGVAEHVDGGTSRFDRNNANGIVYQAVCAGCGGNSNFPTTPGAFSQVNGTIGQAFVNCNNAAFKYQIPEIEADFIPSLITNGPYANEACEPATFFFRRQTSGGVSFIWDFGDGTTSPSPGPVWHTYQQPGSYPVTLTVIDSATCAVSVMAMDTVTVHPVTGQVSPDTALCVPFAVQLEATGGVNYAWSPVAGLGDPTAPDPVASPTVTTNYTVEITNEYGCTRTLTVEVEVIPEPVLTADTTICKGQSLQLTTTPGLDSYLWLPNYALSANNIYNPIANPDSSLTYTVVADAGRGCVYTKEVTVTVLPAPEIQAAGDTSFCPGGTASLQAFGGNQYSYSWSPTFGLSDSLGQITTATPSLTTVYTVTATDGACSTTDTVRVEILAAPPANAGPDIAFCPYETATLTAEQSTGSTYLWSPAEGLSTTTLPETQVSPSAVTAYYLQVTGTNGCVAFDTVQVMVAQAPVLGAIPELPEGVAPYPLQFTNQTNGATGFVWNFSNGLTSTDQHPATNYPEPGIYPVLLTATYGPNCSVTDTVATVKVIPPFVPNIITPNGDGINDVFVATLTNLPLHIQIFNRWGKMLYENDNYQQDWGPTDIPHGIYFYYLSTPDGRQWKGWLEVIR